MRHAIAAAAISLSLASCGSGNEAGNAGAGNIAENRETAAADGGSTGSGAAAFQPGQWEVRAEVVRLDMRNVPNMPAGATPPMPPPTTITYCMTPEQAQRPDANSLTANTRDSGCTYQNFSMGNGRIQGIVQCNTQGAQMRTAIDGRFTATSYEMTQQAQVTTSGITTDMEARTTGRRLGDCPAG